MKQSSSHFRSRALVLVAATGLGATGWAQAPGKNYSFTPVLHSVSYAGVWRGQTQLTLDQFLLKAKELGFRHVEVMAKRPHLSPLDYDAEARKKLRARVQELGLKLVCLAGYPDFTASADKPGIPSAEMNAIYVGEVARLARDLGVPYVRVFTGYERAGVPYDVQWGTVVHGWKDMPSWVFVTSTGTATFLPGVSADGKKIAVALHKFAYTGGSRDVKKTFQVILYDINGKELNEAACKMAGDMIYTTVADYVKQPRYRYDATIVNYVKQDDVVRAVPFGTGFIDYKSFFAALKESGYKGYVAYEMCEVLEGGGSVENLDKTARRFLETFRELTK